MNVPCEAQIFEARDREARPRTRPLRRRLPPRATKKMAPPHPSRQTAGAQCGL